MAKGQTEEERLENKWPLLVVILSVLGSGTSLFYLYTAYFGQFSPMLQRGLILIVSLIFCFIYTPIRKNHHRGWTFFLDCILALFSIGAGIYIIAREQAIAHLMGGTPTDLTVGIILLILVLEGVRRILGMIMVLIPVLFIAYGFIGPYMPDIIYHTGFEWDVIVNWLMLCTEGMFGVAMYVCATVIVLFIAFSAFLRNSGALKFFTDLPFSIFGRVRGGPAKIAVVSSSFMGTLTGSVIANVTATGSFTIPLMKRAGYKPHVAGAIEAASSTGGQIMPPVMGTAAFVMADILGVNYWTVCVAAFLPALLYYVSLFVAVDLEAVKEGLKGLPKDELPSFKKTLASGWFLIPPIVLLIYLLAKGWTPMKACFYAIIMVLMLTMFTKSYRMGPRKIYEALVQTTRDMVLVTIACAAAGIIIGMVGLTGLGTGIAIMLVKVSGGNVLLLLVMVMITCIILGMGMTTLAAYLILALLVGPALIKLGVAPLATHLFIFYFGCLSMVTPPVAIGAYAGAAIAGSEPMVTGFAAWKLALIAFIVPYFFAFNQALIFQGPLGSIILASITAIAGTVCFGMMLAGYLYTHGKVNITLRILLGIGGVALIHPGLFTDFIGFGLICSLILFSRLMSHKPGPIINSPP